MSGGNKTTGRSRADATRAAKKQKGRCMTHGSGMPMDPLWVPDVVRGMALT